MVPVGTEAAAVLRLAGFQTTGLERISVVSRGDLTRAVAAASQGGGSVAEFRRRFIELAAPLEDVPEILMLGQFINGLSKGIKAELRLLNPPNLERAMEIANRIEERNRVQQSKGPVMNWRGGTSGGPPITSSAHGGSTLNKGLVQNYGLPSNNGPPKAWPRLLNLKAP